MFADSVVTLGFIIAALVITCWVVVMCLLQVRGLYLYYKKENDTRVKELWAKHEELCQLRKKYDALLASLPINLRPWNKFYENTEEEIIKERMTGFKKPPVVHLPEVPAGVDTAAQVPNTLCRHCGRPLSGHGVRYNECLDTLSPNGELQVFKTTYQPGEYTRSQSTKDFYTEEELKLARKMAEGFPMSAEDEKEAQNQTGNG